ncbi:flagellar basal body rod protein FlgB [Paenibacillus sp. N1-5-1-14]|uniref:flagellar basal body rod protein FlgB n=1 Tax=Paenibacillus radicibacter TaxID=2972488 RepID=UPI002159AB50|nr:flagellar basal body rod protein FlgB [Paenibacillus radicibacter]MCR8642198.1 flagellar basal body rod protein FlgB [Paenibacillus radicibacter]
MFPLNKPGVLLLERSIDASATRQKVVANNIANVDTPNFKRSEVAFEELLEQQLNTSGKQLTGVRTDPRHFYIGAKPLSAITPELRTDNTTAMNNNKNNVDIDYEMSLMAKNQLRYNTLVQQLNHEFQSVRTVIEGRR